ncbi:MAG: sigma-54-dependent transcriptional regulator [Candidatus Methylomirabilales bacterium]
MRPHQVLVVDDEPLMCRSLSTTIQRLGYETTSVGSGREALRQLERSPSRLIFSDMRMPGMDGLEFLRRVKAVRPEILIIVMTAYGSVETAVQAMKAGATDFLMKPFSMTKVEEILDRTLGPGGQGTLVREEGPIHSVAGIVSRDPKVRGILMTLERVAGSSATVLIQGESGTGKELLARAAHSWSRRPGPFTVVNCAAIPESLLESELFGFEKGAFTGAIARRVGKFEAAHRGTLLLDEAGETPLPLQAKLLRTLQEGEVDRVGGNRPVKVDVRVVATTNRNLHEEVRASRFRQDLFFRLKVVTVTLPPLRERPGDIPLLVDHFLAKYGRGGQVLKVSKAAMSRLERYAWPGNIRELENCLHAAVLLTTGDTIGPEYLSLDGNTPSMSPGSFREMEKQLIVETLERVGGNRTRAAKLLGLSVRTIRNRLREYRKDVGGRR